MWPAKKVRQNVVFYRWYWYFRNYITESIPSQLLFMISFSLRRGNELYRGSFITYKYFKSYINNNLFIDNVKLFHNRSI